MDWTWINARTCFCQFLRMFKICVESNVAWNINTIMLSPFPLEQDGERKEFTVCFVCRGDGGSKEDGPHQRYQSGRHTQTEGSEKTRFRRGGGGRYYTLTHKKKNFLCVVNKWLLSIIAEYFVILIVYVCVYACVY